MKKTILFAALVIALTGFSTQLSAQYSDHDRSDRQYGHQKRIRHGVHNGELTRDEARHLRMREGRHRHDRRMAMRDGRISPHERRRLKMQERRNGVAIYRHKHDRNHRY